MWWRSGLLITLLFGMFLFGSSIKEKARMAVADPNVALLMISLGIADICRALTTSFMVRLAGYGWIPNFFIQLGSWGSRLNMLCNLFGSAQISGLFFITLNRFTAVILPLQHQRVSEGLKRFSQNNWFKKNDL